MTYQYAVLNQFGHLYTRTITSSKAQRVAHEIKGTYKAETFKKGA